MKKNIVKWVSLSVILVLVAGCFSACGASNKMGAARDAAIYEEKAVMNDEEFGMLTNDSVAAPAEGAEAKSAPSEAAIAASRKLIKDGSFYVQTNDFDVFLTKLQQQIITLGGYVESSSISGNSYGYDSCRDAQLVARIPAEKFDSFTETVSSLGTVTSRNETVKDITGSYIDTESHIAALKTEQEALLGILKKASTVSEIIEVQSRLTEVRAELESFQSQLKTYDDLIAYSTVTLNIEEVERVTAAEKQGFFAEVKSRLSDNLYNLGQGLRSFAVWFISSLPYIILFAVVAIVLIFIANRLRIKRKRRKFAKRAKELRNKKTEKIVIKEDSGHDTEE